MKNNIMEKIKEYKRQYHIDNREKICKKSRQYYYDNKESILKQRKLYYKNNRKKILKNVEQWQENNIEKVKKFHKRYRENNWDKIYNWIRNNSEKLDKYRKQYRKDNIDRINEYFRNKRKTDLKYNLSNKIGCAINRSLKGNKAGRHWEGLVSYTLNDLIKRLKKTFPKGYTWQDYLDGKLHIDHKIPISAFNFTKSEHIDFKRCWALKNLQLLPARENLIKHNKLTKPFQLTLRI